jgi:hypothetical protein
VKDERGTMREVATNFSRGRTPSPAESSAHTPTSATKRPKHCSNKSPTSFLQNVESVPIELQYDARLRLVWHHVRIIETAAPINWERMLCFRGLRRVLLCETPTLMKYKYRKIPMARYCSFKFLPENGYASYEPKIILKLQ